MHYCRDNSNFRHSKTPHYSSILAVNREPRTTRQRRADKLAEGLRAVESVKAERGALQRQMELMAMNLQQQISNAALRAEMNAKEANLKAAVKEVSLRAQMQRQIDLIKMQQLKTEGELEQERREKDRCKQEEERKEKQRRQEEEAQEPAHGLWQGADRMRSRRHNPTPIASTASNGRCWGRGGARWASVPSSDQHHRFYPRHKRLGRDPGGLTRGFTMKSMKVMK